MWNVHINRDFLEPESSSKGYSRWIYIFTSPMASCRMFKDPGNVALGMEVEEAAGFMVDCFSDWCHKKKCIRERMFDLKSA